jgi:cation diffusion facilitator CzcD-associated flavoprotein CzcO
MTIEAVDTNPLTHGASCSRATGTTVRVAIIGTGFSGLCTAIELKANGIDDFVVLERADELGGTWQANTYPGAQCDIPSIIYSFSFAPNPQWTRLFPLQLEIRDYLRRCADQFDVTEHIRFRHDVLDAVWDDDTQTWILDTSHGTIHAQYLVAAVGPFSEPATPKIPGLATFEGAVFHSASWNHDEDLTGRRVAVIGTGASAVQFIPHLQRKVLHLSVFQRTPTWILPHPDQPIGPTQKAIFGRVPFTQRVVRRATNLLFESFVPGFVYRPAFLKIFEAIARTHLRHQVTDPHLRQRLTPEYHLGCKRPTLSNAYYPALTQPNVDVITDGIIEVRKNSIVTADGTEHHVDTIILGTGFQMTEHPGLGRIRGRSGDSLNQVWSGDPKAYLGTVVSGFPNLFIPMGPNSLNYNSATVTIEAQAHYILSCIHAAEKQGIRAIDVRPEVQEAFVDRVDRRMQTSVWNSGGCGSFYLSDSGRNIAWWPWFAWQFARRTKRVDLDDFHAQAPHRQRAKGAACDAQ